MVLYQMSPCSVILAVLTHAAGLNAKFHASGTSILGKSQKYVL